MGNEIKNCVACAEDIKIDALVCRHCGTSQANFTRNNQKNKTRRRMVIFSVLVIALAATGGALWYFLIEVPRGDQIRQAQQEELALAEKAEEEAQREAEKAEEEAQREAEKEEAQKQREEIISRKSRVEELEASLEETVETMQEEGTLPGWWAMANCTPISDYTLEDLDVNTTQFECFVGYRLNDNGTQSGVIFDANISWNDGGWSWRLFNGIR